MSDSELKENSPQMKSSLLLAKNSSSDMEKLVDVRPKTNALKGICFCCFLIMRNVNV